jgi:Leucine-rich repeat (LRR) protein
MLDLRNNRLREVPAWVAELPSLEKLDLRWNPLERPPEWVQTLDLRGCAVLL